MLVSLLAGEAPLYLLLEALFTVSLQGGKDSTQGKMLPLYTLFFSPSFEYFQKKITIYFFLTLNLAVLKKTLTTSCLWTTEVLQQKKVLRLWQLQRHLMEENQGPPPVIVLRAGFLRSLLPHPHLPQMHMYDLISKVER